MLHQNPQYMKRKAAEEDHINPKLKKHYEVKLKIEPFYSGGKIVPLSATQFMCQSGSAVKVITTTANREDEENNAEDSKNFGVTGHYECEMDEILGFDACPFSRTLITAHKSDLIRIWNLDTQQVERTIKSYHTLPIGRLEIHQGKSAELYSTALAVTSKEISINIDETDADCESLAVAVQHSKKGLTWATVSGAIVKVWDAGGSNVSKLIRIANVASIGYVKWDIDPKRNRVLVAERNIYVIDFNKKTQQYSISHTCEGHYSQITGIEWNASKQLMVSGGRDKVLILWDAANNFSKIKTIPIPQSIEALTLISFNDLYIALSSSEIRHFDMETHRLTSLSQLPLSKNETIENLHSMTNSLGGSDSKTFLISTHTCAIYVVSRKSKGGEVLDNMLKIDNQYVGSLEEVLAVSFWEQINAVAVANNTNVIKLYKLSSGSCDFLRGHNDIVMTLRVQKKWLVSGSKDNKIIVWLSDSLEPHLTLEGHLASVTSVCFDPTNFIIYSVSEDTFLKAWDLKCLRSTRAHDKEVHSVHCSPNGAIVATASRDKTAKLWNAETFSLLGILKGHKKTVWDVKFSSWDQLVATASADTTIKIWSISTYDCIQTLQGHLSSVLQLDFINLGLQIVSSSSDGTLKLWDIKNSTCLSTYESSDDKLWAMDSYPDGSLIVTGAADSVLTVWEDKTELKVQESLEKRRKTVEDEQRLSNIMKRGDWKDAVELSLELDRPQNLLKALRGMEKKQLVEIVRNLSKEQVIILSRYITKWNTNTKTCAEAQLLLYILFKYTPVTDIDYLDVRALLPYSEKHFSRMLSISNPGFVLHCIADES